MWSYFVNWFDFEQRVQWVTRVSFDAMVYSYYLHARDYVWWSEYASQQGCVPITAADCHFWIRMLFTFAFIYQRWYQFNFRDLALHWREAVVRRTWSMHNKYLCNRYSTITHYWGSIEYFGFGFGGVSLVQKPNGADELNYWTQRHPLHSWPKKLQNQRLVRI